MRSDVEPLPIGEGQGGDVAIPDESPCMTDIVLIGEGQDQVSRGDMRCILHKKAVVGILHADFVWPRVLSCRLGQPRNRKDVSNARTSAAEVCQRTARRI